MPSPRPTRRRQLAAAGALLLLTTALAAHPAAPAAAAAPAVGVTYYVSGAGDDAASGLDEAHAWRSLARVNQTTFQPGDRILLRAGDRWQGQLWPKGSGLAGKPITIDRYGSGDKPRIDGAGTVGDAVRLFNQEYWTIRHLDVSNASGTSGENLRDLRGIHVSGDNSQTLDGFVVDGVDVHDVSGEVNWIGGSVERNAPGIHFQTGWDGSKKTGGIVFDTTVPDISAPPATPTVLNDVLIQNSTVADTSFAGIVVKQYTGDGRNAAGQTTATPTGWGTRQNATDPKFAPHTNVRIRNNFITQEGTPYGCNGMYVTNVRGAVIEHNVVHRAGTSGIETYFADDVTIQFNEVHETQQKAGGADSNGIDPDKGTTRQVVQYNYLHGNGDGLLLCQFVFGDVVVRNNVIRGNTRYQIYLHSDRAARAKIYNNTLYNDRSNYLIYGYGSSLQAGYDIHNNLLYSTRAGATLTTSPTISYRGNLYGGAMLSVPPGDSTAIIGDPLFVDSAPGPSGTAETGPRLESAYGLRVRSGSPAVNTGTHVADNGGRDYAGDPLYNGAPDRGAFEYATAPGASTESVTGDVRTPAGAPVTGAVVTVAGAPATATTGTDGRFSVRGVPFADRITVTATRGGYTTATVTVDVRPGNTTTVAIPMISTSVVGAIAGRVLDQAAQPLADAVVTVVDGEQSLGTATSGPDGEFRVEAVPIGSGYTVRAGAGGYATAARSDVEVTPATTTEVGALLLTRPTPDYPAVHDFDDLTTGPLTAGGGLAVSAAGGRAEVVENPSAADKSARLTRTTNSGRTSVARTFDPPLAGIVTVEARVMIDQPYASGNHWWGVPYIRGNGGQTAISVAFTKNTIVAYSGTATRTLGAYDLGRWYHVATVVDTVNQRFDLYLDGRRLLDDAAFRNSMDGVAQIDYYADSSNYGSVHLDDVRVAQGVALRPDDAGLATLNTDHGQPEAKPGGGYLLEVPARVAEIEVTAVARSPFTRSVAIDGQPAPGPQATHTVALGPTGKVVPVVVVAEDGTEATYPLEVRRHPLAADASLSALATSAGTVEPAFDPDQLRYHLALPYETRTVTVTPTATNPRSTVTVAGKPVPSGSASAAVLLSVGDTEVAVEVSSEDGTATARYAVTVSRAAPQLPQDGATRVPGRGVLSSTSGWGDGLHDGSFDIVMNLWWGVNASVFVLYENGAEIARRDLTAATPAAQKATVSITGRPNGTYVYTGELRNQAGVTDTRQATVTVTDANPGTPQLSSDNWDGDGDYTVRMNMWWGTNAGQYRLFEDGVLVDTQQLSPGTPNAQHAATVLAGRAGTHTYVAELTNAAGVTRGAPLTVTVRHSGFRTPRQDAEERGVPAAVGHSDQLR
ncbi:hypothetical protein E1193_05355 [Micromonospora sp. KC606]|uniref:cadherin-like beta sandwich domain-containing protein n=1 Tax=Micromonospora sp. KC606 TaxID=2530379 RepID=UPI001052ED0D|nr:cadherin-like beta sandwich domain-containing protein [Micromonospora sp. KC606]TDC84556.1 hypothetical protein E1193_05355 [Micromonospora sp. KC606]